MRIEVESREEAWSVADELFPTDYLKDDAASQKAGYPIFESTAKNSPYTGAWISDLNCTLELNIPCGVEVPARYCEGGTSHKVYDIRIDICEQPKPFILKTDEWSSATVLKMCMNHDFYDAGTTTEYHAMLDMADRNEPNDNILYQLAKDICAHTKSLEKSTMDDIALIMRLLRKEAVDTIYTVEEIKT